MPQIKLLPKNISELIAAGEVVERPASVIKELCENSIDAKASVITVEIKNGGISFIRVTDNGCGIDKEDVKTAFLRHATSKISSKEDLDTIKSLGFRGEALASVAAVSRVEMLTSTNGANGCKYLIDGGEEKDFFDVGCPKGTTIIIKDLFYNTPARMKFLKKDVTEANTVAAIIDRLALSHPEISFKFIRDGKLTLNTSGDGKLSSAIFSVLGKDFSSNLINVNYDFNGIFVNGYICHPFNCRANRNGQYFFVNNRYIRSTTIMAALEQAYKNSAMVGKFPCCVLFVNIPYQAVDVNVHPTKTEIRFSDEKLVFDSVYKTVKNALNFNDDRPELKVKKTIDLFEPEKAEQEKLNINLNNTSYVDFKSSFFKNASSENKIEDIFKSETNKDVLIFKDDPAELNSDYNNTKINEIKNKNTIDDFDLKLVGEAFSTYIIVQYKNSLFLIDKHAAHERKIFNQLNVNIEEQLLLNPVLIKLNASDYDAIINNLELLKQYKISIEDFGDGQILLRGVPSVINSNFEDMVIEIAEKLKNYKKPVTEKQEDIFHSISCKAAIKAGDKSTDEELIKLAKEVLSSNDIMFCPHGRTVAFELSKQNIEKQFGRTK